MRCVARVTCLVGGNKCMYVTAACIAQELRLVQWTWQGGPRQIATRTLCRCEGGKRCNRGWVTSLSAGSFSTFMDSAISWLVFASRVLHLLGSSSRKLCDSLFQWLIRAIFISHWRSGLLLISRHTVIRSCRSIALSFHGAITDAVLSSPIVVENAARFTTDTL